MPSKYSHSVVLAHYSSLGLIDLPNDQYIAYLKTCPGSRRTSIASRHTAPANGARGYINSSAGQNRKYRIFEEPISSSRSVASRRVPIPSIKRDVIIESDEGSEEERVILGKKYEPMRLSPQSKEQLDGQNALSERKDSQSVSSYMAHASNGQLETALSREAPPRGAARSESEREKLPTNVINLSKYEATAGSPDPVSASAQQPDSRTAPSSVFIDHIAAQVKSTNGTSIPQDTRIYNPSVETEPNFDDSPQRHFSEVTTIGNDNTRSNSSPIIPRSHFSRPSTARKRISPTPSDPATLRNRRESIDSFDLNPEIYHHPRHNRSFDSISSFDSKDVPHSTTALPPILPLKPQKSLRPKPVKVNLAARDPQLKEDVIDPGFFEAIRKGPPKPSVSPASRSTATLHSKPPVLHSRPSQKYPRRSSDAVPPPQNVDFWQDLEEMLSDSDASVVFPPDIAKYKPRDNDVTLATKADRNVRGENISDGEPKRPTTAPGPNVNNRDASNKEDEPFPKVLKERARNARQVTTVQLVDTSTQKKGKTGFLRRLRKKSFGSDLKA